MPPKRKSDGAGGAATKKAKKGALSDADITLAKSVINDVLDGTGDIPEENVPVLAKYARFLEEEVAKYKPEEKTREDIEEEAETLKSIVVRGMQKLMKWVPSCKTKSAKLAYDCVCRDPVVFGALLGLPDAPKWKMHKYTVEEFENAIGSRIKGSARYATLWLNGNVNVRYDAAEGTFKITATYGI
ncbi:hypothetical protein BD626DRAFT_67502 [Schizophyllum amplum]|uniref:Uncharacterized protein n=1 Tax=Schizophyllum amplum TaxID=97359 RepID=A0A550CBE0_9AGAR|nr:hypothetical protein BD626DRAFT_67502 [Auriculariopsis ampla]